MEWGYLRCLPGVELTVLDCYRFQELLSELDIQTDVREAHAILVSSTPSYLFWRCPPLEIAALQNCISELRRITSSLIVLVGPHGSVDPKWARDVFNVDFVFRGEVDALTSEDIRKLNAGGETAAGLYPDNELFRREVGRLGQCIYEKKDLERSAAHCWRPEAQEKFCVYRGRSALI